MDEYLNTPPSTSITPADDPHLFDGDFSSFNSNRRHHNVSSSPSPIQISSPSISAPTSPFADLFYQKAALRGSFEAFSSPAPEQKAVVGALYEKLARELSDVWPDPQIYTPIIRFDDSGTAYFEFHRMSSGGPGGGGSLFTMIRHIDKEIVHYSLAIYKCLHHVWTQSKIRPGEGPHLASLQQRLEAQVITGGDVLEAVLEQCGLTVGEEKTKPRQQVFWFDDQEMPIFVDVGGEDGAGGRGPGPGQAVVLEDHKPEAGGGISGQSSGTTKVTIEATRSITAEELLKALSKPAATTTTFPTAKDIESVITSLDEIKSEGLLEDGSAIVFDFSDGLAEEGAAAADALENEMNVDPPIQQQQQPVVILQPVVKPKPSTTTKKSTKSKKRSRRSETIICSFCNKELSTKQYPIHHRAHLGLKPFKCTWINEDTIKGTSTACNYSGSSDRNTTLRHIRAIHLKYSDTDDAAMYLRVDENELIWG